MWPVIHQAFGCWLCNAKHRFAGQACKKVSAFMLVPSPLPWCWHCSVYSAHPCIFWLCRESLVLHWESKWSQHCDMKKGRTEQLESQKGCGYCVSASCRLTPPIAVPHCDWGYGTQTGLLRRMRQQLTMPAVELHSPFTSWLHSSFKSQNSLPKNWI